MHRILSSLPARLTTCFFTKPVPKKDSICLISKSFLNEPNSATFTSLIPSIPCYTPSYQLLSKYTSKLLLEPMQVQPEQVRTVIKFSWKKGERKSVRAVRLRFFRLHWGGWIRTIAGRHKKCWKKSGKQRNRALQHVLCNATQCTMLDKMVSSFWRKPKYYIEDPYAPYHMREGFTKTRKKPWRPEGVDYE